jgi:hypothetical protein
MSGTSSDGLLELVVIGAGPHALSLLTRLVDDEPDMLTERERVRIMQKAGSRGRSHTAVRKHLQKHFDGAAMLPGVAVIDAHGRWMAQWESNFDALAIPHTRSHADLHPCPFDFQSLRVFAEARKRQDELWHMQYIDREASRAAGYAGPYVLPGIKLFNDFCHSLVARYGLGGLVRRGTVERIQVLPSAAGGGDASDAPCTFELLLGDGTTLHARRVVCAMGPGPAFTGMRATLPWWAEDLSAELAAASAADTAAASAAAANPATLAGPRVQPRERFQHSSQLVPWLQGRAEAEPEAAPDVRGRRVLVVGGGQTAGNLCLLALRSGACGVTLASRRPLRQKPCGGGHLGPLGAPCLGEVGRRNPNGRLNVLVNAFGLVSGTMWTSSSWATGGPRASARSGSSRLLGSGWPASRSCAEAARCLTRCAAPALHDVCGTALCPIRPYL